MWHSRFRDIRRDADRDRLAAREGWLTLRVLGESISEAPEQVVDDVAATLHTRQRQIAQPPGSCSGVIDTDLDELAVESWTVEFGSTSDGP
jgi:hypothetical protein